MGSKKNNNFAPRLTELRERNGWTKVQLAKHLGCSKSMITEYEQGKKLPGYNMLAKMRDLFEETADYIMGESDIRSLKKIAQ